MFSWWTDLFMSGAMGALVALVLLAFAVLVVATAAIWTLVGLKALGRESAAGFKRGWAKTPKA